MSTNESASSSIEAVEQQRLQRARLAIAVALGVVGATTVLLVLRSPRDVLVALQAVAFVALAGAFAVNALLVRRINERRGAREAAFTRILSGLSRSVSSDSIVQAIVDELHRAAESDHVVVSRLRPADGVVETTLVGSGSQAPTSRTLLPVDVLDPANAAPDAASAGGLLRGRRPEQVVAEEIARRVRQAYGLSHTLAAPLVADGRVVGALVLSRRQTTNWSPIDRRLLEWAADELSAALARAFAFEEAETRANIDALTGLPNRRYLEELMSVVGPRRRTGDSLGALMIDLDHFKALNDRYGHATGDRVLHAVGEAIAATVRSEDTPARYGGEEFAVVLRNAGRDEAVEIAERIRAAIGGVAPARMGVNEPISVSIGVAVSDAENVDVKRLLARADRALYRAKREGRDRVVLA